MVAVTTNDELLNVDYVVLYKILVVLYDPLTQLVNDLNNSISSLGDIGFGLRDVIGLENMTLGVYQNYSEDAMGMMQDLG